MQGYDEGLRERYSYCVNCGARPEWVARRPDGSPLSAPISCRRCKQRPVAVIKRSFKGEIYSDMCQYCRVEHLMQRRIRKQGYAGV